MRGLDESVLLVPSNFQSANEPDTGLPLSSLSLLLLVVVCGRCWTGDGDADATCGNVGVEEEVLLSL